jgi:acetyl-CoA carboxylase carboxyltransferase component
LAYFPANNMEDPPVYEVNDPIDREDPALDTLVPDDPNRPYDVREIINRVVDVGAFMEVHAHYATNIVVGYATLGDDRSASSPTRPFQGRHIGYRCEHQGRALRPLLRLF